MKNEKSTLLISSVLMILSILISCSYMVLNFKFDFINICNVVLYILGIIGSIYFIHLNNDNIKLKEHKTSIFFVSLIFFVNNIISGILGFIVYNKIKGKGKPLKRLEDIKINKILSLILIVLYFVLIFIIGKIFNNIYINLIIYFVILTFSIFVFRKRIVRDFNCFKENIGEYMKIILKTWGILILISLFLVLVIKYVTSIDLPTNQLKLQKYFYKYPLIIAFSACIYAPISEELVFRGSIKELIKNKWFYIIISGLIFGYMHVIDDYKSVSELLFGLVYSLYGCVFAYVYYKTNNIFTNISVHAIQNTLSIIGMIVLRFM